MRELSDNKLNDTKVNRIRGGEIKGMKKILNLMLVFALLLTMVTPAFAADASLTADQKFQALKDAGVMEGYADGTAALDKSMTRAELAKVLAKTFELAPVTGEVSLFEDEPQTHWAYTQGFIGAVVKAGLMEGGVKADGTYGFRPNDQVSLQELAMVLVRALDLTKDASATVEGKTSVWATASVAAAVKAGILNASADYTVDATREALVVGMYATYEAQQAAKAPAVVSVSAINGKQLVVNFNTAVDEDSVITTPGTTDTLQAGVVAVTRTSTDTHTADVAPALTAYAASLSEDGKTLTITADSTKFFKGNYDVAVKGVVSGNDTLENYYGKFTAADTTGPVVNAVSYNQVSDKFEVTLSEPVDALTGEVIRVNGNPIAFDAISVPTKKLTFARGSVEFDKNATLYIAGIKDAAGNLMTSYNGSILATADASALTVKSVQQVSNQVARVTFNKALDTASDTKIKGAVATNGLVVTKTDGTVTTSYTVAAAPTAVNPDGNVYDITFADATYASGKTSYTFTVTFVAKAFKGVSGTENAVTTQSVTLNKDVVAPTVVSTALNYAGTAIEVTISEPINALSIVPASVKLRRDGAELTGVGAALKTGTNNVIEVTTTDLTALTAGKLKAGSYLVRFETAAFTDVNAVDVAATNAPVVTVGASAANPLDVVLAQGGTNAFTVTAPAGQTFTTASLTYTHYTLDGVVIPANSDITLDNTRSVITVKLPTTESVKITGSALFAVNGLSLESGAALNNATKTLAVTDNTAATITNVQVIGTDVYVTFNEDLTAPAALTNAASAFVVTVNGTDLLAADVTDLAAVLGNAKQVKFSLVAAPSVTPVVKVLTGQTVLKDANGVNVK